AGGLRDGARGARLRSPAARSIRALPRARRPRRLRPLAAPPAADSAARARALPRHAEAGPRGYAARHAARRAARTPVGPASQLAPRQLRDDVRAVRPVHAHLLAWHP